MLRGLLALLLLTAAAPGCEAPEASGAEAGEPSARPNIILVVAEDMGPRLGAYGDAVAHTPNLDRLAKRATLFTRAYCQAPACNPSRASLMTGILPSTSGVYLNSQPWRAAMPNAVDPVAHAFSTLTIGVPSRPVWRNAAWPRMLAWPVIVPAPTLP